MTCCVILEGLGVLDFSDEVSVGAERTQGIGLGERFGIVVVISD